MRGSAHQQACSSPEWLCSALLCSALLCSALLSSPRPSSPALSVSDICYSYAWAWVALDGLAATYPDPKVDTTTWRLQWGKGWKSFVEHFLRCIPTQPSPGQNPIVTFMGSQSSIRLEQYRRCRAREVFFSFFFFAFHTKTLSPPRHALLMRRLRGFPEAQNCPRRRSRRLRFDQAVNASGAPPESWGGRDRGEARQGSHLLR